MFDLVGGKSYTSLHIVLWVWVPWFFFLSNQSLDFAGQSLDTHFSTLSSKSKGSKSNSNFHKFFGRENRTSMTFDNHICLLGARIYCICKSCKRVWHKLQKDNTVHHTVRKTSLRGFWAFLQIRLFFRNAHKCNHWQVYHTIHIWAFFLKNRIKLFTPGLFFQLLMLLSRSYHQK